MTEQTPLTDEIAEVREDCGDCHHQHGPDGCYGLPSASDLWAGVTPSACDCTAWKPYRPRVSFTFGSITKVVTARRRYVCANHLSGVPKHYIEPGQRHAYNRLPPHNSEIGNATWWQHRHCLDCCPVEYDERLSESPTSPGQRTDGARPVSRLLARIRRATALIHAARQARR